MRNPTGIIRKFPFRRSDIREAELILFWEADSKGNKWLGFKDSEDSFRLTLFEEAAPFSNSINGYWFADLQELMRILREYSQKDVKEELLSESAD